MESTKRTSIPRCFRILLLFVFILLSFSIQSSRSPSSVARAVGSKTLRVAFNDGSGKYLELRKADWYLYSSGKKALGGLQYLSIPKTKNLASGFYMFDKKGKLVQKKAVYQFNQKTVNGVTFNGFHYTSKSGRFPATGNTLIYLSGIKCSGKTFKGYYFLGKYGQLTAPAQVRYLNGIKAGGVSFKGYYYFNKYGQLCTKADFHTVNQTVGNRAFSGTYYFGSKNGRLTTQKGWITYKGKRYYINADGKKAANCWKSGYYLQANGTIARNKTLSDGTYVGYDGRKYDSPTASLNSLKTQLQKTIRGYRGSWSVYVKDLKTGAVININEKSMYPASTIKAFVMAATYDRINRGKLSYSSSIRRLLTNMITISDNESYNVLVRRNSSSGSFTAGAAEINKYLKNNGYKKTGCHSSLHPAASSRVSDGHSNTASAKDCGVLLEKIYQGKCVSKKYSKEMLNLLCRQTRRGKIPAGIPSGVKVANKTGETSTVQHDMAIVYGPSTDYVICVFSSGCGEASAVSGIRSISRKVYNYLN